MLQDGGGPTSQWDPEQWLAAMNDGFRALHCHGPGPDPSDAR